ncbi:MAG: hypothetical protein H0X40_09795 [Chthoniobacterales bacterium]|nr:hypothetical protein [Chthoniobacterales bacterium]
MDIVASRFGWPDWIERALIIASYIGFFVAVVLAWYHGERGAQRATGTNGLAEVFGVTSLKIEMALEISVMRLHTLRVPGRSLIHSV